ncbi:MAG: GNAT family N-acetyltransferase [Pontibacterium sp.]
MVISIRKYTQSDLDRVMSAWENANRLAHPFLKQAFVEKVRHDIPNLYLPNAETWVADVDGHVVGFIALLGNEVGAIFVEPDFQGIGAGKALMDKAQQLHGDLEVEVFKENAIGRKFYARYGFEFMAESSFPETGDAVYRLKSTVSQIR